jgi:hypothetical protein
LSESAEQAVPGGVERPAVNFSAVPSNELLCAAEHFLCGAPRESQEQNSFRLYTPIDEVSYAIDESSGFSCACTSDDE